MLRIVLGLMILAAASMAFANTETRFHCQVSHFVTFTIWGTVGTDTGLHATIEDVLYQINPEQITSLRNSESDFSLHVDYVEDEFINIEFDKAHDEGKVNLEFRGIRFQDQRISCVFN